MTTNSKWLVAKLFFSALSRSKTSYGIAGLVLLYWARWFFGPVMDGAFRINGFMVNWNWSTDAVVAVVSPLLGLLAFWGRAVAEGPLWPTIKPVVDGIVAAIEQDAQTQGPAQQDQSGVPHA